MVTRTPPGTNDIADRVLRVLTGSPRPIAVICAASGLARRDVEAGLQTLRLEGNPVASSGRGVWMAGSADELASSNETLRHRLVAQYLTLRAQRSAERVLRMRAERFEMADLGL